MTGRTTTELTHGRRNFHERRRHIDALLCVVFSHRRIVLEDKTALHYSIMVMCQVCWKSQMVFSAKNNLSLFVFLLAFYFYM